MNSRRGFTLLEVLIALAIFSICALVILKQISQSVRHQERLETKTIALWIAENTIATRRLEPQWPDTGSYQSAIFVAEREWVVEQDIEATTNNSLRKITVSVHKADVDTPDVSLTGFLGKY